MSSIITGGTLELTCKRGHGNWFMMKRVGRKTKFCEYIMGYTMKGDSGTHTIYCGGLRKNAKLPKGYISLTEVTV